MMISALVASPAQSQAPTKSPTTAAALEPLAPFAGQRVVVVPTQFVVADSGAWLDLSAWSSWRKTFDDSLGAAIAARGIGRGWSYAADVLRQAKRNPTYTTDPYALGAQSLRRAGAKAGDQLSEQVAGNLRPLIALGDARYLLLPVELKVETQAGKQRARLRLYLVDGRAATILWVGEVIGDAVSAPGPALLQSLVRRVADLVVPEK